MNKLFTVLCLTLLTCFQLAQADVTVTFNVNMNHLIVSDGGVFVAGGAIGNPGDNELTDPDGDGIYSGSITFPENSNSFYTILNGNCGDYSCKERVVGQSCSDPANFDDRSFVTGDTDVVINTCFGVCSDDTACSMVSQTFNVNMSNEAVSPDGVFLAGGLAFGQPGDIPMLDPENDGIYSVTLDLPTDYRDYFTYTNGICPGDFNCKEQLGGQICASPEHFNDRLLVVPASDMTYDNCFGVCSEDGSCDIDTYDVTFQVDMNGEGANPAGVFMGSDIDGWSGNIALSDPDGDGIYSVTLNVTAGFYQYKFINGPGWVDGGEFVPIECDVTGGANQNRGITVLDSDVVLPPVCFGSCTEVCPVTVDVTFRVDMSNEATNPGGVFMGANFDGWSGGIALSDPDGDDVWEYTTSLPPGAYEYKFINGPGWVDGGESVPDACNVVLGSGFQNRGVTVPDDGTDTMELPVVCFKACIGCDDFVNVTFRVNMALENVSPDGVKMGSNIDGWSGNIGMSQLGDSDIWTVTMTLPPGSYEYKFINGANWCCPESVPTECDVTVNIPGGPYQNRGVDVILGASNMTLPLVCFGSCENCPRVGCTDPGAHNFSPRAIIDPGQKTFYWDDVMFIDASTASAYCGTPVTHFAGDPPSAINLTIENVDASSMEVVIESADATAVDFLLVNGGSGAAISDQDLSVPGQIKRTLTWAGTPPADVVLNVLWSKEFFEGQWLLSTADISVPFGASCSPPATVVGDFPITFDDPAVNYDLVDFGGNISAIVEDPTDPSNMVVETTKTPLAPVWAGTTAGGGGLSSPIPFTATSTKLSVDVWSPQSGVPVLLKVEDAANGGISSEVLVHTTVSQEWETLVFDFANGTPALNLANTYDKVSIFFDFGNAYPESICETCSDGEMNGDEVGVDCGGSNPNCSPCNVGCTDPTAHNYDDTAVGNDGSCETCDDNEMNGDETGVDCGGALCAPCEEEPEEDPIPLQIEVDAVSDVPASGVGTASIAVTVLGGDTDCVPPYSYEWTGPGGYSSADEDINDITEIGDYTLVVTDCNGDTETVTVRVEKQTRRRGRNRKASIIVDAFFQASPNPFNQETMITFNLAVEGQVSLNVYDITGKQVAELFNNQVEAEKNYQFQFGNGLPAGTYIATLTAASGEVRHIKLVLAD